MPRTESPAFRLTAEHVASQGEAVLCLASAGLGRRWDLYPRRPGAEFVARVDAASYYGGASGLLETVEPPTPVLRVDIRGPIEESAGYHDECGAWSDGNDAIAERLCAAFAEGDVLLCVHSPGGNPSLAPEGMRRALEAKAASGRRCILHVEGMAASLAFWWGVVISDEVWIAPDARMGSIGARGAHGSIAGALAIEGVAVTFSTWPDDGKAANVPELPQSPVGKARNDRDVALVGVAFASAIAASPLGMRRGLTVDVIRSLPGSIGGADVLTGIAAVAAGLADGIATLEETAAWALESAGTGTGDTMTIKAAEEKPPKDGDDEEPDSEAGAQPSGVCAGCGMGNRAEAKFCDQCGASMAAPPMEPPPGKDGAPTSSKRPGALAARAAQGHRVAPAALASVPALRTALSRAEGRLARIAALVGAQGVAGVEGAVEATVADAQKAKRYREERNAARVAADFRERMDILASLSAADPKGHPRRNLVKDKLDGDKIVGLIPTAQWSDGPEGRTLANLRAYARTSLAGLPSASAERSPYDRPPAEASEGRAAERVTAAHVEAVRGAPAVQIAIEDGIDPKVAAESYARRFGAQGVAP